jgi:LacI family transcriptional regulator
VPGGRRGGGGRPRLLEVAELAGVSLATVSNVLNHPNRVTAGTRTRVQRAIEELGFTRNTVASALARGDTRTIGLVVIGLSNSLYVDMARGAQQAARADDRHLRLATAEDDHDLLVEHLRVMAGSSPSGLLVSPVVDVAAAVAAVRAMGSPVVVLNHDSDARDSCRVLVDNEQVGYLAARHMIALGHRRLAFVAGSDVRQPIARRRRGIHRAIAETSGAVHLEEFDAETLEPESGAVVARALLARPARERPDGIIAVSDLLAMAVISEFRAAGLRVPEDAAVMGCDHNSAAWGGAVPLTSVTMEGTTMGSEGVRLLLRELQEPASEHVHTTVMLEPRLLAKESTIGRAR